MTATIYLISSGVGGLFLGLIIMQIVQKRNSLSIIKKSEQQARRIIKKAHQESDRIKKEKMLQAKERFIELKTDHEKVIIQREKKLVDTENQMHEKDKTLNKEVQRNKDLNKSFEQKTLNLDQRIQKLDRKSQTLDEAEKTYQLKLEEVSGLTTEDAKKELITSLQDKAKTEAMSFIQNSIEEAKLSAEQEAKKIIIGTIQRIGTEEAVENCVSVFNLESDDVKGRIIGREGRNIRAIEAATGVEIIVDDTPEAIILSCFDPVRREIARLSLHRLVTDGRIHPARIEEVVTKTSKKIENEIAEVGKRTVIDLGIHGLNPVLIKIIGRMKYRSSYGQNLLQHSREVAKLCGVMASELGLNPKLAKRAGLLHDIGKVPEEESELPHAILGMQWAEKYGEKPDVCNAIGAHHDEVEMTSLLSPIVQVCDAISGARPGARRQVLDSYIQRLKDLETIALDFNGVSKAYAIQAGRELRVIVESEKVTDNNAAELSFQISQKIQTDMTYPGQVKVTVIRETRAVNVAK